MPAIGSKVTFTFGERKPRTWRGEVLGYDSEGYVRVFWPTMRYHGEKGVVCSHTLPCPWLVFEATELEKAA